MTTHDEAPRPKSEGQVTTGEVVPNTVPQRSDNWRTRARRNWPAVATYLLATGVTWPAAACAMATDPGLVAALLTLAAASNTVCAVVGIVRLVRS